MKIAIACAFLSTLAILSSCGGDSKSGTFDQSFDIDALRRFASQFETARKSGDSSDVEKTIVARNVRLASADTSWGEVPYYEPERLFAGDAVLWALAAGYDGFENEARYWMIFTPPGTSMTGSNPKIDVLEFARRDGVWHLRSVVYYAAFWGGDDYYLRGVTRRGCGDCFEVWERWEGS